MNIFLIIIRFYLIKHSANKKDIIIQKKYMNGEKI